jgi:hypothetical protein
MVVRSSSLFKIRDITIRSLDILVIAGVVVFVGVFICLAVFTEPEMGAIRKNPGYALGVVMEFTKERYQHNRPGTETHVARSIRYSFSLDGKAYFNFYSEDKNHPLHLSDIPEGYAYLVVYNRLKPSQNLMLLNYRISDSTEFKVLMKKIKEKKMIIEF